MKLDVSERLLLLSALPPEGDITTIEITAQLRRDLSFTEDEHELLKFRYRHNCPNCRRVEWSNVPLMCPICGTEMNAKGFARWEDVKVERDFEFGKKASEILVNALEDMSSRRLLTEQHIPLYRKFIPQE